MTDAHDDTDDPLVAALEVVGLAHPNGKVTLVCFRDVHSDADRSRRDKLILHLLAKRMPDSHLPRRVEVKPTELAPPILTALAKKVVESNTRVLLMDVQYADGRNPTWRPLWRPTDCEQAHADVQPRAGDQRDLALRRGRP